MRKSSVYKTVRGVPLLLPEYTPEYITYYTPESAIQECPMERRGMDSSMDYWSRQVNIQGAIMCSDQRRFV